MRRNTVGPGHLTLMMTSAADGSLLPTTFIHPGERGEITQIPIEAFPRESEEFSHAVQPSAYVDEEIFQSWLLRFILAIDKRREKGEDVLLILDGHSSRLNVITLLTAAKHRVHILCLPSHLTHILQPNDAVLNRTFKDYLQDEITGFFEADVTMTSGDVSAACVKALQKDFSSAICSSFRSTGIWPVKQDAALSRIRQEKPNPKSLNPSEQLILEKAEATTSSRLGDMNDLLAAKRGREDGMIRVRKSKFSTKMARLLDTSESITALAYSKELSFVTGLKAQPLHNYLVHELKFPQAELMVSAKKLEVEKYYTSKWGEKEKIMTEHIQGMLPSPPPGFLPFLSSPSAPSPSAPTPDPAPVPAPVPAVPAVSAVPFSSPPAVEQFSYEFEVDDEKLKP